MDPLIEDIIRDIQHEEDAKIIREMTQLTCSHEPVLRKAGVLGQYWEVSCRICDRGSGITLASTQVGAVEQWKSRHPQEVIIDQPEHVMEADE